MGIDAFKEPMDLNKNSEKSSVKHSGKQRSAVRNNSASRKTKAHSRKNEGIAARAENKTLTIANWLLLLLLAGVPVLGWIVLIYGVFSKNSTIEKVTFCKAYLLFKGILLCTSLILSYISAQILATVFQGFLNYIGSM